MMILITGKKKNVGNSSNNELKSDYQAQFVFEARGGISPPISIKQNHQFTNTKLNCKKVKLISGNIMLKVTSRFFNYF